jgi:hypothetical protein
MSLCAGCDLDNRNRVHPICLSPPSDNIKGCIISRDPTSAFIKPWREHKNERGNFQFGEAPPKWLFERIQYFMGFELDPTDIKKLKTFLDMNCYWTHFHKCPTDKQGIDCPRFSYFNGERCADRWFEFEFTKYNLNDKILILLGRDLERYFQNNPDNPLLKSNRVFYLPHPSMANCGKGWSWNKNKAPNDTNFIKLSNQLNELISRIKE